MDAIILNDEHLKKSNNIILLSDIHFGVRNNSIEWMDNIHNYFFNFFIPFLKENSNENTSLIIMGDIFDSRQSLDIKVLNIALDIITNILKVNNTIKIYIVEGNHDSYKKKDNDITSLSIFKTFNNVVVIQKPTLEILDDGTKFLFVPWNGDMVEQNNVIRDIDSDFVFMHNDINSGYYDNGRPIINGVDITTINNKKIYSGHIHKRYNSKKFTYVGTPYQLRRSDIGNKKGIYILSKKNKKWQEKFVENNFSPEFFRIRIEDILEKKIKDLYSLFHNNYVDIVIKKSYAKYINQQKILDVLSDFKFKRIFFIVDKEEDIIENITNDGNNSMSIESIIENKIKNDNSISQKIKEELLKMNKEYLDNAIKMIDKNIDY